MQWRTFFSCVLAAVFSLLSLISAAQSPPQLTQLNSAQLWQRLEFRIANVPSSSNPFDPNIIRVDATFTSPSAKTLVVPAFWFQNYQRGLAGQNEVLSTLGAPEWRLRFAPSETGTYQLSVSVYTNGVLYNAPAVTNFTVPVAVPPAGSGYVRIAPSKQYFETGDGHPLRLIGENVCWHGSRGTYDYDDWFPSMQGAGENYARIWMCPWAFGVEEEPNSLTQYRLDHAWQLDYVVQSAEQHGIYLNLCLEYHGMFEIYPDYWGGNNFWTNNPYNTINGGPCLNQNGFFTNTTARTIYEKRLRYLIGRYGYSPNLLTWQFFNEIDNVYAYLNPNDVAAWHNVVGGWLHTNDPFGHLVTTSLTGSSDRPEIWAVPQMDFANYHSYHEPGPAKKLNEIAQSFLQRYGKLVLIDEFGTDSTSWGETADPYLRGFREGLWGGALGGSAGTAMSWWWQDIHGENVYTNYSALDSILNRTGWGIGTWTNIQFNTSGGPPMIVGDPISNAQPVNVTLPLGGNWGAMPLGRLAVPDGTAATYSAGALNSFGQGGWHSELKTPFVLSAWLTNNARLVMHLNSVSEGSILVVKVDGSELYRTNLANLDGTYNVNNEYNIDLAVNLPAGKRSIVITNVGNDWFFLDWVRLEQVLPSTYSGGWIASLMDGIGLRGPRESLVYTVAPNASFPAGATDPSPPLQQGQSIALSNWPSGIFYADWYDPETGAFVGSSQAGSSNNNLTLPLPDFRVDLAGIIYPPPTLKSLGIGGNGDFQFLLDSETGGRYLIERSTDMKTWTSYFSVTNDTGTLLMLDSSTQTNSLGFLRAKHQ